MRPVEIVSASENPKQNRWLKWVGLQGPPIDADSWVPVVRGLRASDEQFGNSKVGTRLIKLLAEASIQAEQQSYEFADDQYSRGSISGLRMMGGRTVHRIAVMVRQRDQQRAIEIATELNRTLAREARLGLDADVDREEADAGRRRLPS
jgi:hypothetical protein